MADENIRSLEVGDPEEVEDIQLGAGEPEETEEIVLAVDVDDDVSAKQAEAWAVGERGGVPVSSTDPAYENNAKYYAGRAENAQLDVAGMMDTVESARLEVAEMMDAVESIRLDVAGMIDGAESARDAAAESASDASGSALDAEAWAVGQRNGTDVVSTDPAYANNARYYAGRAASSAGDASGSATAASESAQTASGSAGNAEAWAVGKRNGVDVGSGDSTYHNNAKYYAGQAATSASQAENSVQLAAGYATNASGSADTASQYAQAATQKASAANTSAGNAAASEQAASQSKTLAGQSASAAAQSEQNAAASAQSAGQYAGQASGYASNASDSATAAAGSANAAGGAASNATIAAATAEAWAVGQRNGTDVVDTDPAYENNALYYAGRAAESATAASGSAGNAAQSAMSAGTSADNAEAWAVGQREGTDVESTDPAYENNAKYYAGRAAETLQAVAILESGSTATHAIVKGEYVVWQGIGCVALSDIAIGDTLATSGAGANLTICAAGVVNHLSEQKADNILKTISTPAAVQTFDDGADNLLIKQMKIAIDPVQAGTGDPSPTNVRAISGWTGANVIVNSGNLINPNTYTAINSRRVQSGHIHIKPNQWYFIKPSQLDRGLWTLKHYDKNGNEVSHSGKVISKGTNGASTRYRFICYDESVSYCISVEQTFTSSETLSPSDIPLSPTFLAKCEADTTDMDFVPFAGATYPITFPSEAGTVYGGTLTVNEDETGTLVVDRAGVDLGTLTWTKRSNPWVASSYVSAPAAFSSANKAVEGCCSCYRLLAQNTSDQGHDIISFNMNTMIYIRDDNITNLDDAGTKTYLNGQTLVYKLATPISYTLTVPEVCTLLGLNNIYADTGNVNSITYRTDENINYEIDRVETRVEATQEMIAPAETLTATSNHAIKDIFVCGDQLLRATAAIATGETVNTGTGGNAEVVTVADLIAALAGGVILKQPKDVAGAVKDVIEFHVETENIVSYQWMGYYNSTWHDLTSYTGNQTSTLSYTLADSNKSYRMKCRMVDRLGQTLYTREAQVYPPVIINSLLTDYNGPANNTFTMVTDASNAVRYRWELKRPGEDWAVSNETGDIFSFNVQDGHNGRKYRYTAYGQAGDSVSSNIITINVT